MIELSTLSNNVGWVVAIVGGLVTLAVLVRKGWHKVRRAVTKGNAVVDTLVGRPAIYHPESGKELEPASPGIGARMVSQEEQARHQAEQMALLTDAVSKIAASHARLEHVESRLDAHDEALAELKAGSMERVMTRAESTQAWQTIESAINAQPPEHDEP